MKEKLKSFLLIIALLGGAIYAIKFFKKAKTKEQQFTTTTKKLKIVTTTGIVEDTIKNIAGDLVETVSIMGPGIDPHSYKAAPADLKLLNSADIIVYNGLHLEGKLSDVLEDFNKIKPTYAAGECLGKAEIISDDIYAQGVDPHIWFDIRLWKKVVKYFSAILIKHDPENKEIYIKNTYEYLAKLDHTDELIKKKISTIPADKRILITAHDAFEYFGRAYDIKVKGLQGISTASDYGLKDITNLIDLVIKNKIRAIFIETSVPQKPIMAVIEGCKAKGHDLILGGALYSDALGEKDTEAETYIGMLLSNLETIYKGLSSDK